MPKSVRSLWPASAACNFKVCPAPPSSRHHFRRHDGVATALHHQNGGASRTDPAQTVKPVTQQEPHRQPRHMPAPEIRHAGIRRLQQQARHPCSAARMHRHSRGLPTLPSRIRSGSVPIDTSRARGPCVQRHLRRRSGVAAVAAIFRLSDASPVSKCQDAERTIGDVAAVPCSRARRNRPRPPVAHTRRSTTVGRRC